MKKQYEIMGFLGIPSEMKAKMDKFIVNVTVDQMGATLSITHEGLDRQFTVPIDLILKEIEDAKKR